MIGAPVPGAVNALQVTIPGRSPSVPSVKALGNARDEKRKKKKKQQSEHQEDTAAFFGLYEYPLLDCVKIRMCIPDSLYLQVYGAIFAS